MLTSEIPDEAWTHVQNIAFRDGIAQKITGDVLVFDTPPGSVAEMQFYPDPQSGTRYWIMAIDNGTDTRIYKWDTLIYTDITGEDVGDPYDLTDKHGWTSGSISGVPYFNNGTGAPWVWLRTNGIDLDPLMTDMATLFRPPPNDAVPLWPTNMQVQEIRAFKNFWILLDITESGGLRNPSRLIWSDPAEPYQVPSSFDVSDPSTLAGDVVLGDTADYLMDALQLRGLMVIYKRNETWVMRPTGGQQLFTFDRIFKAVGLMAPRMVVPVQGTHHFMVTNDKDIIMHDGNTRQSIADAKVRHYIFSEIDEDNLLHAFVAPHYQQEEIWFHYPTSGYIYANKVAIYNYMSGAWSFRDIADSRDMKFGVPETDESVTGDIWGDETAGTGEANFWGDDSGAWTDVTAPDIAWSKFTSATLIAQDVLATNTDVRVLDTSTSFAGQNYLSRLERTGLDMGDIQRRKEVRAVYPKAQGGAVRISIGAAHDISGPYTWSPYTEFDPVNDHKMSVRKNGRFIGIRFEGPDPWRISGYDLDVVLRGTH